MPRLVLPTGPKVGPLGMRPKRLQEGSNASSSSSSSSFRASSLLSTSGKSSSKRVASASSSSLEKSSRHETDATRATTAETTASTVAAPKKTYIGEDLINHSNPQPGVPTSTHRHHSKSHSKRHLQSQSRSSNVAAAPKTSSASGKSSSSARSSSSTRSSRHPPSTGLRPETMTSNQPRSDGSNATNKNRALALDTRFLVASGESSAATSTGQSAAAAAATMTHYYSDFLRTLAARGACPGLVAVTTTVSKSTKPDVSVLAAAGIVTKAHVLCTSKNALQRVLTSQTVIEPIIVQPLDSNASGAVSIPAVMSAESSWSLFGSMVESLLSEYGKLGSVAKENPLDITILSMDASLFSDISRDGHAAAATQFVKRVAKFFSKSQLKSIQIITALSGTLELQLEAPQPAEMDCSDDGTTQAKDALSALEAHKVEMAKCIQAIESTLDTVELPATLPDGKVTTNESDIVITHAVIEYRRADFKRLTRQWIRDSFVSSRLQGRLNFDLPATTDGTQCSVELDATYQIFPFAINSPQADMLLNDLKTLSDMNMSVVQLIPLATIDASLLFGIPMKVCSGLGSNSDEFHEMGFLVRSLFSMLQEREMALLLRAVPSGLDALELSWHSCSRDDLFQSNSTFEHLFVLMAQEVSMAAGHAPTSGLLHRIAHADQLLLESSPLSAKSSEMSAHAETEAQYTDYIEAAFAEMPLLPFNPLTLAPYQPFSALSPPQMDSAEQMAAQSSAPSGHSLVDQSNTVFLVADEETPGLMAHQTAEDAPMLEPVSSVWSDTVGVGSCGPLLNQETADPITEASQLSSPSHSQSLFFKEHEDLERSHGKDGRTVAVASKTIDSMEEDPRAVEYKDHDVAESDEAADTNQCSSTKADNAMDEDLPMAGSNDHEIAEEPVSSVWSDAAGVGASGPPPSQDGDCLDNGNDDGDVNMFDTVD